jgi:hypothetical protein
MRATVDGWLDEPVPPETRRMARDASDDHAIGWRIRNLRPDQSDVAQLVKAWTVNEFPPPVGESVLEARDVPTHVHNARLDLAGLRISAPERFRELIADPAALALAVPDASAADIAFARGDYATAIREYRSAIGADPERPGSWAGLAMALRQLGPNPAATALTRRPELVAAVFGQLAAEHAAPAPDALADWLAGPAAADR